MAQIKKVNKAIRWMGQKSTTNEGPILYFEYGTIDSADTTLATDLTNVIGLVLTGKTAVASGFTDGRPVDGDLTISVTGTGEISYILIGTIETLD